MLEGAGVGFKELGRVTAYPTLKIQQEMEESIMKDPSVMAH